MERLQQSFVAPPPLMLPTAAGIQGSTSSSTVEVLHDQQTAPPQKKRRNLPGNPSPDAEIIALSPRSLMASNRFVCEVCGKGFQREQNLQLHRRGHNLPWKLRQRSKEEVRRRKVYLCPEPTCVHHHPSRALGDLTGVKKHFYRKHGEKKWKCERCSKKYAVQSDWKAHSKTCGTREYRCDCAAVFSRRDSFITHRAFCDALAQETARIPTSIYGGAGHPYVDNHSSAAGLLQLAAGGGLRASPSHHQDFVDQAATAAAGLLSPSTNSLHFRTPAPPLPPLYLTASSSGTQGFQDDHEYPQHQQQQPLMFLNKHHQYLLHHHGGLMNANDQNADIATSSSTAAASLFNAAGFFSGGGDDNLFCNPSMSALLPQMSATALLQKAAWMGSTCSSGMNASSLLMKGFGSSSSATPSYLLSSHDQHAAAAQEDVAVEGMFADGEQLAGVIAAFGEQEDAERFVMGRGLMQSMNYIGNGGCNMIANGGGGRGATAGRGAGGVGDGGGGETMTRDFLGSRV